MKTLTCGALEWNICFWLMQSSLWYQISSSLFLNCFSWVSYSLGLYTISLNLWITCRARARHFSCVLLFVTPWTVACQAPLSMGFPRQEYWDGLPFPSPEDLPNPGIKPTSPALVEADGKGQFLVGTMIQKYNFSVYFQRKWNWVLKKYLHSHVPCSIIYTSQDIEST